MGGHEMLKALRRTLAVLGLLSSVLSSPVLAQPAAPKPSAGRPAQTARAAAAAPTADQTSKASISDERKARIERYQKWAKDWRARRETHRKARLKRLHYRLNRVLKGAPVSEAVRAELTAHAQRLARLYRIKEIAIEKEDEGALTRVEGLLRREYTRHERWLSQQQEAIRP